MRNLLILFCFALSSTGLMAQSANVVGAFNSFIAYEQTGGQEKAELVKGYEYINKATIHESTKDDPKTWWYKAYITLLMDQDSVIVKNYPDVIYESSEALEKAYLLASQPEAKKFKFMNETQTRMGQVTVILYNRAVEAGIQKNDVEAYKAFKRTHEISQFMKDKGIEGKNLLTLTKEAKYYYAQYALALNKTDEAKRLFNEIMAEGNSSADLYLKVAAMQRTEGKDEEALATLQKGMKLYPNDLALVIDMINIYLQSGRETEAIDAMVKAIELDPKNHQLYFVTGVAYGKIKNYDKAIEYYNQALQIEPTYADAYNNIGAVYLDMSNDFATKKDEPKVTDAQYKELDAKRLEYLNKAIPALEKANELKPGNIEIMDVLRTLYAKIGDYTKADAMKKQIAALKK